MKAYCLDWHITKSDAFREMLVNPLAPWIPIELTGWNRQKLPTEPKEGESLIFCQFPPSAEILLHADRYRITWLPMWDSAKAYDQEWWSRLPKTIKVVAFSREIYVRAVECGLPVLNLRFFFDPSRLTPVDWAHGRVLLYWNRTGMVGPGFLRRLCNSLSMDRLILLSALDPRISDRMSYRMPGKIGRTEVEVAEHMNREDFLARTEESNVFLAPRTSEGVGMSFLEAMARGAAVFAYDAPTMNEYISAGRNGFLFPSRPDDTGFGRNIRRALHPWTLREGDQDWQQIEGLDLAGLGQNARSDHLAGFACWKKSLPEFADFIQL